MHLNLEFSLFKLDFSLGKDWSLLAFYFLGISYLGHDWNVFLRSSILMGPNSIFHSWGHTRMPSILFSLRFVAVTFSLCFWTLCFWPLICKGILANALRLKLSYGELTFFCAYFLTYWPSEIFLSWQLSQCLFLLINVLL